LKKSLANLNLDECQFLDRIEDPSDLYKFDMNKALDSEDEYNVAKRRPRTKPELAIVRPWQNKVMARFLSMLLEEAGEQWLLRDWVLNRYKESGVPITWPRIAPFNIYFEKKAVVPPFSEKEKKVLILPLKSPEANIIDLEDSIVEILLEKVQQLGTKFTLPVRLAEMQKEIQVRLPIMRPPLFIILKQLNTTPEQLFYTTLEERGRVRDLMVERLTFSEPAKALAERL